MAFSNFVKVTVKKVNELINGAVPMGLVILRCRMAVSRLLIAGLVDAVVVRFARQGLQIAVRLLCQDDVWIVDIARNPFVCSHKVSLGVDGGNLVCATGAAGARG